ncbi:MAG: glycosyltransferase family 2 protein [Flavobacteriaceae bacterium]|jgi:glycosyltransferase involved in cell wall biosynthesis|nr:MAG: glycosyltransferase family 2 protein [Flavobacteriaceae bacterium]
MKPLLSLLMPFKNTARFLPECLESICQQDYENWELIAVDDHSTDQSRALLQDWALRDPRIRVTPNLGTGIIPALRTALAESRGLLISRMDSDDRMAPGRLQAMTRQLLENGKGHIALGLVRYFSHRGISDGYARYERWLNQLTRFGSNFNEIYKECVIPSPCWMVFREDLERCEGFRLNRYPEDYDLCFRFYQGGMKCLPSSQIWHYWRDYDHRTSRTSEHYAQNYFLDIKLHYFLKLDRNPSRPLVIWGAGFKGKTIAKNLKAKGHPFRWFCDNPKKIGKKIHGIRMEHYSVMNSLPRPQSIITVANEGAQTEIREFLHKEGAIPMEDYFFFC